MASSRRSPSPANRVRGTPIWARALVAAAAGSVLAPAVRLVAYGNFLTLPGALGWALAQAGFAAAAVFVASVIADLDRRRPRFWIATVLGLLTGAVHLLLFEEVYRCCYPCIMP